jgi:SAM-dependent methyltransferase
MTGSGTVHSLNALGMVKKDKIGAVIRANFEHAHNQVLGHIHSHASRLKGSRYIAEVVLAIPDTPYHRQNAFEREDIKLYFGNPSDMISRMLDAARCFGLDVIVDVPLRTRLEPIHNIDRMIEYHVRSGGGYTEPHGWKINLLPRIIDVQRLETVRKISNTWPYYGTIHTGNLGVNYYRVALNRLYSDFIDKMDPLHLAHVHHKIGKLLDCAADNARNPYAWLSNAQRLMNQIQQFMDHSKLSILEIGCGQRFGLGIILYLLGVRSYVGIDIASIPLDRIDIALLRDFLKGCESTFFGCPANTIDDLINCVLKDGDHSFFNGGVRLLSRIDAASLPFDDETFDVIFSNAVLEHVKHPETAIKEMARTLKPEGIMCHSIDFRDHHPDGSGFRHLYMSKASWQNAFPQVFINLYRFSDLNEIFLSNGLEYLDFQKHVISKDINIEDVNDDYRVYGKDELSIASICVVIKKPDIRKQLGALISRS